MDMHTVLTVAGDLAYDYVRAVQLNDRDKQTSLVPKVASLNGIQTLYFAQQVTSYFSEVHRASLALTVLTNLVREHLAGR